MSNNVATAMGDHQSHPRLAQQAEEVDCSTCSAITEDSAVQNETGALLRLCPVCGRAWPLFTIGERGAMAQSACDRVNRQLPAGRPSTIDDHAQRADKGHRVQRSDRTHGNPGHSSGPPSHSGGLAIDHE